MESALASAVQVGSSRGVVRLVRGDITELDVDAFVFYAQPDLALGSGFGGAIAARGGPSVQKELEGLALAGPLPTGVAVATGAGKLKARHIIHAVGPRFREPGIEEKLRRTVVRCLEKAVEVGARSLAFPAMGCGYYGIPPAVSARIMNEALRDGLDEDSTLEDVVVCVFDTPQYRAFETALATRG